MKKIYTLGAACLLWASLALGQTTVKSYTTSGSFVIPSCVTSITITARGAAGSNGAQGQTTLCPGGIGGYGAIVSGVYSVTPSSTLILTVGGMGNNTGNPGFNGGGVGGFSGAGPGAGAGGGGGASDVRIGGTGLNNRILVAGGGGGGGKGGRSIFAPTYTINAGGNGGNGGIGNGLDGNNADFYLSGSNGGKGATSNIGGLQGIGCAYPAYIASAGSNGVSGNGGNGGAGCSVNQQNAKVPSGGGGGGGYFGGGGGGGAAGSEVNCTYGLADHGGGGGGAGGSNYFSSAFTNTTVSVHTLFESGLITLSYVEPLPDITASSLISCAAENVTLTANGATSYTWSNNQNTSSIVVNPTSLTTYTVLGELANGCVANKTIAIDGMIRYNVGYLSPIVSPTVFCNSVGGNVIFNDNYNGPTGGNFQNNLSSSYWAIGTNTYAVGYYTLPISTTTNYTLFAYYNGRPCPGITSGTIHVLPPPPVFTATPSSSLICQGSPITINASAADNYFIINSPTITVGSPFTPTVTTTYTVVGIMNSTPVLCGNGGGQAVFTVSVSACTGINEVTNSNLVSIYPNPANDFMTISLAAEPADATTIYIINALGEIVLAEKATSSNATLNINNLTSGIYFIKVESKNVSAIKKFIKQ